MRWSRMVGACIVLVWLDGAPDAIAAKREPSDAPPVDELLTARFEAHDAEAKRTLDDSIWARVVASSTPVVAYWATDTTPPVSLGFEVGTLHRAENFVDVVSHKGEFAKDSALESAHVDYEKESRAKRFDCAHRTLELARANRRAEQYDSDTSVEPIERGSSDEAELDIVCRADEVIPALNATPTSIWVDVSIGHESGERAEIAPGVHYPSAEDPQATFVLYRMSAKTRQTRWHIDTEAAWIGIDCAKREWRQLIGTGFERGKIVALERAKAWAPIQPGTSHDKMFATVCGGE